MSGQRKSAEEAGQFLLETAIPIVEGQVNKFDALMVHAAALAFAATILWRMSETAKANGKHAAAKTVEGCMMYLYMTGEAWAAEADALEEKP